MPAAWQNWLNDYSFAGMCLRPVNKEELIQAVTMVYRSKGRAVGSGHSHSCCARPNGMFIDISGINGAFNEVEWIKSNPGLPSGERAIRIKAGTRIKTLNRLILPVQSPALGLPNMGTFDGQTLAGAISTGTHGTGATLGSLADLVLSMDIVTVTSISGRPSIQMRRIEPTNGVTDPEAFNAARSEHGMVLEQNDDTFYAIVVGYGCMGVVYSYTLRVQNEYWLREDAEFMEWPTLRSRLVATTAIRDIGNVPTLASEARHVWFMVNLAETQGKKATTRPGCLVYRREIANRGTDPQERRSDSCRELGQDIGGKDPRNNHDGLGGTIRRTLEKDSGRAPFKKDRFSSVSYIVHRREQEDHKPEDAPEPPPRALSAEIALPATSIAAAVDCAIGFVDGTPFYLPPCGIRFAAPSKHYMASNYGRATAYIEVAMTLPSPLIGKDKAQAEVRDSIAKPDLTRLEEKLCYVSGHLGGRPHLGKHNTLNYARATQVFPSFSKWLAVYRRFNPFGTFNNQFTDQLGISVRPPST